MALVTGPVIDPTPQPDPSSDEMRKHSLALQRALQAGDQEAAKAISAQLEQVKAQYEQGARVAGATPPELIGRGIKSGAGDIWTRGKRLAGKSVGLVADEPSWTPSDEEMAERGKERSALDTTKYGSAGREVGTNAVLAPLGVGLGSALRKVGAVAGKAGFEAAGKLLSSTPVRAGLEGAAMGSVSKDDPEEGALEGAATGYGLVKAGQLGRRLYNGIIKPTSAAKSLMDKGVDLTIGQMAPRSAMGQFEEAGQSAGGIGSSLKAQRDLGRESWQQAALREGVPPGGTAPEGGPVSSRLRGLYDQFKKPYAEAVAGESMYPANTATPGPSNVALQRTMGKSGVKPGLFDAALNDPLVTDETKNRVQKFLDNQLSIIGGATRQTPRWEKVPAEALQTIRSNIRQAVRERAGQGDVDAASLLVNAEKQVTAALESQLPADKAALLKNTDRQYARYKTVEGAAGRAGDAPDSFTPAQLSAEVKKNMDKGYYARGGGGSLRRLAAQGREVLDTRSPPTGARYLTVGGPFSPTPWLAAAANAKPVKNFLTGNTKAQKSLQLLETTMRRRMGQAGRKRLTDMGTTAAALYGNRQGAEE